MCIIIIIIIFHIFTNFKSPYSFCTLFFPISKGIDNDSFNSFLSSSNKLLLLFTAARRLDFLSFGKLAIIIFIIIIIIIIFYYCFYYFIICNEKGVKKGNGEGKERRNEMNLIVLEARMKSKKKKK